MRCLRSALLMSLIASIFPSASPSKRILIAHYFHPLLKKAVFITHDLIPKSAVLLSARVQFFLLFLSFRIAHPQREIHVLRCVFFLSNVHREVAPFYFRLLLQQWPVVISADEAAGLFETKNV